MLVVLVEHSGRLLGKDALMERLWPDQFVEEVNLNRNVSTLRRALGERPGEAKYIETVPKHGYRFIAEVREVAEAGASLVVERHTRSEVIIEEEETAA